MTIRSTTDPERFRTTYYGGRRYIDPLPADGTWEPTGPKEKLVNCTSIAKAVDNAQFWKKLADNNNYSLEDAGLIRVTPWRSHAQCTS